MKQGSTIYIRWYCYFDIIITPFREEFRSVLEASFIGLLFLEGDLFLLRDLFGHMVRY